MAEQPQYFEGIGRRKEASARVRIHSGGSGNIIINDKSGADYLTRSGDLDLIEAPLRAVGVESQFNVTVIVKGGGVTGQTSAIQLGIARALLKVNADYKPTLRHGGFLTRDSRIKERKKPGLKRARKAPTYTKR